MTKEEIQIYLQERLGSNIEISVFKDQDIRSGFFRHPFYILFFKFKVLDMVEPNVFPISPVIYKEGLTEWNYNDYIDYLNNVLKCLKDTIKEEKIKDTNYKQDEIGPLYLK